MTGTSHNPMTPESTRVQTRRKLVTVTLGVIASVAALAVGTTTEAQGDGIHTSARDISRSANSDVAVASSVIPVVAYDITETPVSGWGGWAHAYTGTIEDTGRTTGPNCSTAGTQIANYSNGSGTLNDAVSDEANIDSTHLLCLDVASDGDLVRPAITVKFAEAVLVDRIVIHGGGTGSNIYPGAVEAATITIGDTQVHITSVPAGISNDVGVPRDDVFDLTTSGLSSIATNQVIVGGIVASFFGFPLGQAAIAEITVEGRPASTPVALDIRPASRRNLIDLSSPLPVPLAILSSAVMDVRTIDVATLRFGHLGNEDSLHGCTQTPDFNRDRRPDLVCLAEIRRTGFVVGDTEGVLTGSTTSGTQIIGRDDVTVHE
jgi:hypothetical protein